MIIKKLDLPFGSVTIMDRILVAELNEGILLDKETNLQLLEIGRNSFKGAPYGYISYRTNSYAVDPMVYIDAGKTENLKAIAVVTRDELCRQNAQVERKFYKNQNAFEVFQNLEEALNWMKMWV